MKILDTVYNTIAAVSENGTEYIAIPIFEDYVIEIYKIPGGNTADIPGRLYLPDDAELIDTYDMDDCQDADAVYNKCERLLMEM